MRQSNYCLLFTKNTSWYGAVIRQSRSKTACRGFKSFCPCHQFLASESDFRSLSSFNSTKNYTTFMRCSNLWRCRERLSSSPLRSFDGWYKFSRWSVRFRVRAKRKCPEYSALEIVTVSLLFLLINAQLFCFIYVFIIPQKSLKVQCLCGFFSDYPNFILSIVRCAFGCWILNPSINQRYCWAVMPSASLSLRGHWNLPFSSRL